MKKLCCNGRLSFAAYVMVAFCALSFFSPTAYGGTGALIADSLTGSSQSNLKPKNTPLIISNLTSIKTNTSISAINICSVASDADWHTESNQTGALAGGCTASAGDVNGDGYDDVLVPAQFYTDKLTSQGKVELFYGSAAGLSPTPAWSAEGSQAGMGFGALVASAGDVNGDGYDDVLISTGIGKVFLILWISIGAISFACLDY